jgi:hypothetical protein
MTVVVPFGLNNINLFYSENAQVINRWQSIVIVKWIKEQAKRLYELFSINGEE